MVGVGVRVTVGSEVKFRDGDVGRAVKTVGVSILV